MNKAILSGNIGQDAELRYASGNGQPCSSFSLATNKTWKDKSGEKQQETQWHNCVLWGTRAESLTEYLKKGSHILVVGEIKYRKYTGKDGVERHTTDIHVDDVEFLGGGKGESGGNRPPHPAEQAAPVMTGKQPANEMTDAEFDRRAAQSFGAADVAKQFGGTVQPPSEDIPF